MLGRSQCVLRATHNDMEGKAGSPLQLYLGPHVAVVVVMAAAVVVVATVAVAAAVAVFSSRLFFTKHKTLNPKLSCQKASSLLTQAGLVDDTTRPRFLPWSSDTGLSNTGASLLGGPVTLAGFPIFP